MMFPPTLIFLSSTTAAAFTTMCRSTTRRSLSSSSTTRLNMMSSSSSGESHLVTIQQAINAHQSSSSAKFIDGSWHMPVGPTPRNARSEYINGPRIPNALYFDIDDISSSNIGSNNLPHMKPSSKMFAIAMDRMNISSNDTIYVYGTNNCAFYHRTYWTINNYHNPSKVKLIQGSLDEWKECGGELEYDTLDEERDERLFRMSELSWEEMTPRYKCWNSNDDGEDGGEDASVVDMEQVLSIVKQNEESDETTTDAIIVDARSSGRFYGKDPEPRPGLRGGHMPGAINVPFLSLLDGNDVTKFKPKEEVRDIFIQAGIQPLDDDGDDTVPRKVICSCGSGVTAAALAVGLEECGLRKKEDISIYDGSKKRIYLYMNHCFLV